MPAPEAKLIDKGFNSAAAEPNAIKIQGSVITGSCKYRKNLQGPVVFKLNAIKHIFPVFTGIFL